MLISILEDKYGLVVFCVLLCTILKYKVLKSSIKSHACMKWHFLPIVQRNYVNVSLARNSLQSVWYNASKLLLFDSEILFVQNNSPAVYVINGMSRIRG